MSDTPRTDAIYPVELLDRGIEEHGRTWGWGAVSDFRDLARQLERELASVTKGSLNIEEERDELDRELQDADRRENSLMRELAEATAENNRLRAALASSKDPCVYCQLPKDEMAKCRSGFPGCARADDLMGCQELGASLEVDRLERELNEAQHRIRSLIEERDSARIQADHKWRLREEFEVLLGTSDVKTGVERVKEAQKGAARYEYIRKLTLHQYGALMHDCMTWDLNFDAEVDRRRNEK